MTGPAGVETSFSDRTVLVTGASSGIGRATAVLLSRLGARLVLAARNSGRLEQTLACLSGGGHAIEAFDLGEVDRIAPWMKTVAGSAGPLYGLVHAAGVQQLAPVRLAAPEAVRELMNVNLHSAIALAGGFCRKGGFAPGGGIVFISSVMGLVGQPARSVYSASKAALIGLTRSLAVELAPLRIRVNCIAPAFVEGEMLEEIRTSVPEEQFAAIERAHPLGFGRPDDVANAVAFLLGDGGRWITGTTLVVDGGYSAG